MRILRVAEFGRKPMVHHGIRRVFFSGELPKVGQLITLTFPVVPGLPILPHGWRPTLLADFLDCEMHDWIRPEDFSVEEYQAFFAEYLPKFEKRFAAALTVTPRSRARVARKLAQPAQGFAYVYQAVPQALAASLESLFAKMEIQAPEIAKGAPPSKVLGMVMSARSHKVREKLLEILAGKLRAESREAVFRVIRRLAAVPHVRYATEASKFFEIVGSFLDLKKNTTGKRINITFSWDVVVEPGFDAYLAHIVGPVTFGKKALRVSASLLSGPTFLIAGDRRLRFEILREGGTLKKHGNTLILSDKRFGQLDKALLEVEKVDVIAYVNPEAVIRMLEAKGILDARVREAADRAKRDYREARALADLAIERLVGVDAGIARDMYKAQKRSQMIFGADSGYQAVEAWR